MTKFMIRLFVRDFDNTQNSVVRQSYGYMAGGTGIGANLVLFIVKIFMGFATHSIAIMADAFNNLTDCASSVMTVIGFWSSTKPADKEHPFGHGRSEYITALVVSVLVIMVGVQFVRSAVERIMSPVPLIYDGVTVMILMVTIFVKVWLALFYRTVGRTIGSRVMEATALDSMGDVATTGIVVLALIAGPYIPFAFDGYVGLVVALLIIWNGWNLVMQTLSPLLGEAPDEGFVEELQKRVSSYEGVLGHHDLIVHNYGHGRTVVSLHVEVPVSLGMIDAHEVIDTMEKEIALAMGIDLVVHMDPVDCENQEIVTAVEDMMKTMDSGLSIHDFRIVYSKDCKKVFFELVIPSSFSREEAASIIDVLKGKAESMGSEYQVHIQAEQEFAMLHTGNPMQE
jgi:cation diffusion facilitator family transporter